MFFRREKERVLTFDDRLGALRGAGYTVTNLPKGGALVSQKGLAAIVKDAGGEKVAVEEAGILLNGELALLTDVGYQKIFRTDSGKAVAAQAEYLKAIHAFTENLKEALGVPSLYNEGLGSVNERHLYDRVEDRDHGVPKRPWDALAR